MPNLSLPVFKAPEGYKNLFKMSMKEMADYFDITDDQAYKLFITLRSECIIIINDLYMFCRIIHFCTYAKKCRKTKYNTNL